MEITKDNYDQMEPIIISDLENVYLLLKFKNSQTS
jgi:hypothetical protein